VILLHRNHITRDVNHSTRPLYIVNSTGRDDSPTGATLFSAPSDLQMLGRELEEVGVRACYAALLVVSRQGSLQQGGMEAGNASGDRGRAGDAERGNASCWMEGFFLLRKGGFFPPALAGKMTQPSSEIKKCSPSCLKKKAWANE
jgi:hypothetical protein